MPFVPSDGKADEVSAIPGQFHISKQIGNLPDEVRSSWPGRRPVPAGRPNVARTCDGGSPALAPPQQLRTPPRDEPGHARGRHQWRRLPFFWAGSIFAEQRGSRGFGSVKPL